MVDGTGTDLDHGGRSRLRPLRAKTSIRAERRAAGSGIVRTTQSVVGDLD
jgi:hypothetical protein